MMKGHDEHAFYLKELMRLQPIADKESRALYLLEKELISLGCMEKAQRFREVKMALYDFVCDCRIRNTEMIEKASLNRNEWKLLRHRFVRGYPWKKIYSTQGYSPDHCKRIHRDAIAKVARVYADTDFKPLYEQEQARLDELLRQIGEKE